MPFQVTKSYHYDQKKIIAKTVLDFISENKIISLLDIGAGSTETVCIISSAVKKYIAVEQDPIKASRLKACGVTTVNSTFPCALNRKEQFGLVLVSHSIPETPEDYLPFFREAWRLVSPQGYLMIITLKGANSVLSKFSCALTGECSIYESKEYQDIIRIVSLFGVPNIQFIISTEESSVSIDLAKTISWSLNLDYDKFKKKIIAMLEAQFFTDGVYRVAHDHVVITIRKQ